MTTRNILQFLFLLLLFWTSSTGAAPVSTQHTTVELVSDVASIQPGVPFHLGIRLKLDEGWHTYWINPGDAGVAPDIQWTLPAGLEAGPVRWPHPERLDESGLVSFVYHHEVLAMCPVMPRPDLALGSEVTIKADLRWAVCKDTCLFATTPVTLRLPVLAAAAAHAPEQAALFKAMAPRFPVQSRSWNWTAHWGGEKSLVLSALVPAQSPAPGTVTFYAYDAKVLDDAAPQIWRQNGGKGALELTLAPGRATNRLHGILVADRPWQTDGGVGALALQVDLPLEPRGGPLSEAGGNKSEQTDRAGSAASPSVIPLDWRSKAGRFHIQARDSGYMDAAAFKAFLAQGAASGQPLASDVAYRGLWMTIALVLLGGLALNLTPCVLPLIPINLAIIGAGTGARSKVRGFVLGGVYGLGMALAYGGLGLMVVLTGSTFGSLNASPWFNAGIAVLFLVMALAMFDVLSIDFTRFHSSSNPGASEGNGRLGVVLFMGIVAALLAGACVAPVVISVLVLAGGLYAKGVWIGLLLPFLLGLGMALPWPLAGAGLAWLPKPGRWMVGVKYGFGVLIVGLALYYAHEAYAMFRHDHSVTRLVGAAVQGGGGEGEPARLAQALSQALKESKPVLIDFGASWCKNCLAMERTTFKEPSVQAALDRFVVLKFQAERPNTPEIKAVLDYYGVLGLPTYVVLTP